MDKIKLDQIKKISQSNWECTDDLLICSEPFGLHVFKVKVVQDVKIVPNTKTLQTPILYRVKVGKVWYEFTSVILVTKPKPKKKKLTS